MADPIYLVEDVDPALAAALQRYLGPLRIIDVTGPLAYDPALHLCSLFRLADSLGEVAITVPETAPAGHSFAISSPAGSWPHIVIAGGGAPEHPFDHTRGLPKGVVSLFVTGNPGGAAAAVQLLGATQP